MNANQMLEKCLDESNRASNRRFQRLEISSAIVIVALTGTPIFGVQHACRRAVRLERMKWD